MKSSLRSRAILTSSLLLGLALLPPPAQAQRGALTLEQNLGALVEEAATIVRGHVISARVEPHPEFTNLHTVVVTLRVEETLKGEAGDTFTFRQYIWDIRDRYDAAGYRKGHRLLLLMIKPSRYGLSSPAGLEQGRFRIVRDRQGNEYALNGHSNAALFRDLPPRLAKQRLQLPAKLTRLVEQHRAGPVERTELEELIRTLAGTK